jgi:hypothetical protein
MMMRPLLLFGLVISAAVAAAQQPDIAHDFILTDKDAIGVLSPRVVCASRTIRTLWSSDGSVLLVHRVDSIQAEEKMMDFLKGVTNGAPPTDLTPPRQELVFYSPKANRVKAVVPIGDPENQIEDLEWLPGSQQVVVRYAHVLKMTPGSPPELGTEIALVSSDGKVTPLLSLADNSVYAMIVVSPSRPMVAVMTEPEPMPQPGQDRSMRLQVFGSNGRRTADAEMTTKGFGVPVWSADGGLYFQIRNVDMAKHQVHMTFAKLDLATGKVGAQVPKITPYEQVPPKLEVRTFSFETAMGRKDIPFRAQSLALAPVGKTDGTEVAIVSSDAQEGDISPNGEAIAYVSRGITLVRPLVHIPKEALLNARLAAKRMELLSQAKQIGLGFLMYAGDNDDNLPGAGGDLPSMIGPYLKNNDLFNGFTYTFKGGSLTDVEAPSSTELGRVSGAGGNAVVYVDGHAKWIPDKGKP